MYMEGDIGAIWALSKIASGSGEAMGKLLQFGWDLKPIHLPLEPPSISSHTKLVDKDVDDSKMDAEDSAKVSDKVPLKPPSVSSHFP